MNPKPQTGSAAVWADGSRVHVSLPSGRVSLPLRELPSSLVDWIDAGRRAMYRQIAGDPEGVSFFSQHLPTVVTRNDGEVFPFNCGNKGVGYLPRPENVGHFTELYQKTMDRTRGAPWQESLRQRLEVASRFNFSRETVDLRCLGSLEIFEKTTYRNLCHVPLASLLYTGTCPAYVSYQINCAVEVIGEDDPRYTFLRLSRTLFEYDGFHIAQPGFRCAYVFWVSEVIEKTPYRMGPASTPRPEQGTEVLWEDEAWETLSHVPGMVREHVRCSVEAYARERGFRRVTSTLLQEAQRALRLGGRQE